jgi:FKBP-type peptidyl-prolyl cis-trans isomerase 2
MFLKLKKLSQVKENNTVKVHYTGKLSDGQVLIALKEFTLGQGRLIQV